MMEKNLLKEEDCLETGDGVEIEGKVVVLDSSALPEDSRDAQHQLYFCMGGNGTQPNLSGGSVFMVSLVNRRQTYWKRSDILGIAKPEILTELARMQLSKIRPIGAMDLKKREPLYSAYCFLPNGRYPSATWLCSLSEVENYIYMQKDYQHRIMICDLDDFCLFEMVEGEILYPTPEMIDTLNASQEKGDIELNL